MKGTSDERNLHSHSHSHSHSVTLELTLSTHTHTRTPSACAPLTLTSASLLRVCTLNVWLNTRANHGCRVSVCVCVCGSVCVGMCVCVCVCARAANGGGVTVRALSMADWHASSLQIHTNIPTCTNLARRTYTAHARTRHAHTSSKQPPKHSSESHQPIMHQDSQSSLRMMVADV